MEPFDDGFGCPERPAGEGDLLPVHGPGLGLGGHRDLGREGQHVDVHVLVNVAVRERRGEILQEAKVLAWISTTANIFFTVLQFQ